MQHSRYNKNSFYGDNPPQRLDEMIGNNGQSRSTHKQLNSNYSQTSSTAQINPNNLFRPTSCTGILNTVPVPSAVPSKLAGPRFGPSGTFGVSTIEYDDPGYGVGLYNHIGGEDLEAHFVVKEKGRLPTFNPRNQVSTRLHKTIDENLMMNRMMSGKKP